MDTETTDHHDNTTEDDMTTINLHNHADYDTSWTIDTDTITTMVSGEYITCYTCGEQDLTEGLFDSAGTATCLTCALKYSAKHGLDAQIIPTDEQRTTEQAWRDAGIGTN